MQTTRRIISSFTIAAALASFSAFRREGLEVATHHSDQPLIGYGGGNQRKLSVPIAGRVGKKRLQYVRECGKNVKLLFPPRELSERDLRYLALAEEKRTRRYPHRAVVRSLGLPLRNL